MRLIKGTHAGRDRTNYLIRDLDATGPDAHDIRLYTDAVDRDAAFDAFQRDESFRGDRRSIENGGHWGTAPVWGDAPEPDASTDAIVTSEFPGSRSDAAQAKLRELVHERNQLRRDMVTRQTEHAAEVERLRAQLDAARAPITEPTDDRLTPIWDLAAEAANDNGFCPEYDKLCASLGIPGRERTWRGTVTVTLDAYVYVSERGEDSAIEAMEARMREEIVSRFGQGYYDGAGSITNVDVQSIEAEDVEIY